MAGSRNGSSKIGRAAVELRVAGASFADIAETLALSSAREALGLVERELSAHLSADDLQIARAEASERILTLLSNVWDKANEPSDPEHLAAVRQALSLVDRHIRLHGLDRPSEVIIHTPTAAELDRWVAAMVSTGVPGVIEADVVGGMAELSTGTDDG